MIYPKRSEALKNSPAFRAYNERRKGVSLSKERKRKISEALKKSEALKRFHEKRKGVSRVMSAEWLEHIRLANQKKIGMRLSLETRQKMSQHEGEERYNWKGGIRRDTGNQLEVKLWRDQVLCRDNHTCQECGNSGTIAHHIFDWETYPDLRFDIDNGLSVCRGCHMKIHEIGIENRFAA